MLRELRKVFRVMCAVRCGFSSAAEPVQRQRGALPRGSLRMLDTTLYQLSFESQDMSRPVKDSGYFLDIDTSLFLTKLILGQIIRNCRHLVRV